MTERLASSSAREAADVELYLHAGFLHSVERFPERPALEVGGQSFTYRQLRDTAAALAATLQHQTPGGGSPLTAVFAHRSPTAYTGILGALLAGTGYVPLNRTYPTARTQWMLQHADCRSVVVDSQSEGQLDAVLEGIEHKLLVIAADRQDVGELARRWPRHVVIGAADLDRPTSWTQAPPPPDAIAYLLYTSGSTGTPKGVMVSHRNVTHFLEVIVRRYGINETDRLSQMFDATFDLSVFDLFCAWSRGACVCSPSEHALLNPDKYIRESALTVWASVPSVGGLMKRFGILKKSRYASLRLSVFCGEPLPAAVASAWQATTPDAVLDNLYGPTELTVACTCYRWNARHSEAESRLGVVPIGETFPGMTAIVVDQALREVPEGEVGELLVTGPQMTLGYWRNAEATARSYVVPPDRDAVYYRTGDRARRPFAGEPLTYVGRQDHQVKVLGYRVELGEVESMLRQEPGVDAAVAVAWPMTSSGAAGIVAFVSGSGLSADEVRASVKTKLQPYAVPHTVHVLPHLPQNANGKIDRQALQGLLES